MLRPRWQVFPTEPAERERERETSFFTVKKANEEERGRLPSIISANTCLHPGEYFCFTCLSSCTMWLLLYIALASMVGSFVLKQRFRPYQPREVHTSKSKDDVKDWLQATSVSGEQYLVVGVGFVGKRIVDALLKRGETKVRCFDVAPKNPYEGDSRVEYICGNVCEPKDINAAMKGVDTCYCTFAVIRFCDRLPHQGSPRQDKTIQGMSRQGKTRQDMPRRDNTRQDKTPRHATHKLKFLSCHSL